MVVAIVFAQLWGVLQMVVLGSFARTVGMRTVLLAMAAGLYAAAPLAILLQVGWTRPFAQLSGFPLHDVILTAAFTVDPFIEETVKVLPLVALMMVPVIRRQWSITDCVLLGAAMGSGFGLAEHLYRFSAAAERAVAVDGGWIVAWYVPRFVPSVRASLTSWLPSGVLPFPNQHLCWSALAGLAVGLWVRDRRYHARFAAVVMLLFVGADHAAWNARLNTTSSFVLTIASPFALVRYFDWAMPIAAIAAAWWVDRRSQVGNDAREPRLSLECAQPLPIAGTIHAALIRLPWSLVWVDAFVRLRRARNIARAAGSLDADRLDASLHGRAARLDDDLARANHGFASLGAFPPSAWGERLRRPAILLWLVLITPPVVWSVFGARPETAFFQRAMTTGPVGAVVLALSIAGQVWLVWQFFARLRTWLHLLQSPTADTAAAACLHALVTVGTAGFGLFAMTRSIFGAWPTSPLLQTANAQSALGDGPAAGPVMMAGAGVGAMPPLGLFGGGATATAGAGAAVAKGGAVGVAAGGSGAVGGAVAGGTVAAGAVVAAGVAVGAVAPLATAMAFTRADELAGLPDPDEISLPGGVPQHPDTIPDQPGPFAPTIPAPGPGPTWPVPPPNPAPDYGPGEPVPYPGDPSNPNIPPPPRIPSPIPEYQSAPPLDKPPNPPAHPYPPDWQHGAPTRPTPDDPHVAPDPRRPKPLPPSGPYR